MGTTREPSPRLAAALAAVADKARTASRGADRPVAAPVAAPLNRLPGACRVAVARIEHAGGCWPPVSERGPVPGGDCWADHTGSYGIYSPCDGSEGWCPAPDCVSYGPCLCLCHL